MEGAQAHMALLVADDTMRQARMRRTEGAGKEEDGRRREKGKDMSTGMGLLNADGHGRARGSGRWRCNP